MDGFAVRRSDFDTDPAGALKLIGESLAGHPFEGDLEIGECVRVFTGAVVPDGADQVLLQEECASIANGQVTFEPHVPNESYVRPVGHDVHAGAVLAEQGDILDPFALGGLAAAGVAEVCVYAKPVVGVFSTGDELVDAGTSPSELAPGQIYDSNRFTVLSLLQHMPCTLRDLGRLADDAEAVRSALARAADECAILITSGGVSVGEADHITDSIESLGELNFWRLNLKPGKPLAFGRIKKCFVFGLPGNPVSTIVTLMMLAKPAIRHHAGAHAQSLVRMPAVLDGQLFHAPGRVEYQRGILRQSQSEVYVSITGDQSSNRLSTFHRANCLIEVPKEAADLHPGAKVFVLPFTGLLD
jgi:molybdopterin molybdotransferase